MPLKIDFTSLIPKSIIKKASPSSYGNIGHQTYQSNPLTMDAKSILAQQKVSPRTRISNPHINEDHYKTFEKSVLDEARLLVKPQLDKVWNRINPINNNNYVFYRNTLLKHISRADLRQQICKSNTPEKLFETIKLNMEDFTDTGEYANIMQSIKTTDITPAIEKEASGVMLYEGLKANRLMDDLTPKSTISEVINIEEFVRKLGVNDVNFSDDLEQAKLIKKAVEDLVQKKMPLPNSIKVTPFMQKGSGGCTLHDRNGSCIWLRTSLEDKFAEEKEAIVEALSKKTNIYRNASPQYQQKYMEEIAKKKVFYQSTKNPKHSIYHEAAHCFQPNSIKDKLRVLSEQEMRIAGEISIYAQETPSGSEAMPEMFSKIMNGDKLTPEQMVLYLKLGGIVPR